jgi:hypothetical protein
MGMYSTILQNLEKKVQWKKAISNQKSGFATPNRTLLSSKK